MTKDNRRHIRIDSINLTYFALDENDKIVKQSIGRTLNVSESGILLETHIPVDLKQAILLAIGLEDDVVDIKGNVIYSADCENGKYKTLGKIPRKMEDIMDLATREMVFERVDYNINELFEKMEKENFPEILIKNFHLL